MNSKILIGATKRRDGQFIEEEIIENLDGYFSSLEYIDTPEVQIWEYPSGKIYAVKPDKEVTPENHFQVPQKGLWIPKLVPLDTNLQKVQTAYSNLTSKKATNLWLFKTWRSIKQHFLTR